MPLGEQDHPAGEAARGDSSWELVAGIRLAYRCTHAANAAALLTRLPFPLNQTGEREQGNS